MATRGDSERLRFGAHHCVRGLYGLLHDITQRPGLDYATFTSGRGHFYGQQLSPNRGPRQAGHLAHLILLLSGAKIEFSHPEQVW